MKNFLEPLLAILAIVVPLVVAYIIVSWQERKPACSCRKAAATTHDNPQQKGAESTRAGEDHAAQ